MGFFWLGSFSALSANHPSAGGLQMIELRSDYPLDHHVSAWMVREIVDHFARAADHFVGGAGGLDPRGSVIRGLPTAHCFSKRLHSEVKG